MKTYQITIKGDNVFIWRGDITSNEGIHDALREAGHKMYELAKHTKEKLRIVSIVEV